jgi:putative CocE/NonD family hydrolase
MVDGWIGDDWFQNGAFRQKMFSFFPRQHAQRGAGVGIPSGATVDDYTAFLAAGSAGDYARKYGLDRLPFVQKLFEHPSYDQFWQEQAVDKLLAKRPLTVPTMLVVGQWDQEDSWGAPAVYAVLEPKDTNNDLVSLVVGPWRHSGVNYDGSSLGALKFSGDTGSQFRNQVMKPFLDRHLRPGAPQVPTPPVYTYATGINEWQTTAGVQTALKPLYLNANFTAGFDKPAQRGSDSYVSDPAKPVPFMPRPARMNDGDMWRTWLIRDQRFVDGRPDVLSYTTDVLTEDVHILGAPVVDLHAATTGTDSDWVVKLIDVYPEENSAQPDMAGYQLALGIQMFRGRYRDSLSNPSPIPAGRVQNYKYVMPTVNHVFRKGHRIMVQVQSTLFPLYDRNPQTSVKNIFFAKPGDYRKATQSVHYGGQAASAVLLPVVAPKE